MFEEETKEFSFNKNKSKENISTNIDNLLLSPVEQKNKYIEEKNMEINCYNKTSDCSQKTKINEEKFEKEKINQYNNENFNNDISSVPFKDNNSNLLLNKEQLYDTFLLFQKFLMATQNSNGGKIDENLINNKLNINNYFVSKVNDLKVESNIKNNNKNIPKEISNNQLMLPVNENITSNFQLYNKNSINKIKSQRNKNTPLIKNNQSKTKKNNTMSSNIESYRTNPLKKNSKMISSASTNKNKSKDKIRDFKDINCSKINSKKRNKINDSFTQKNRNSSNDYSFDLYNNTDSYSNSNGDSLRIMTSDIISKNKKINQKIDSNLKNHNKTSKSNDINKILFNLNSDTIRTDRETDKNDKNNLMKSYNNKGDELLKNIKKITVTKNNNLNSNKEQIIEEKIKELNAETIKFREEKNKVIKIKKEYEKLHEELMEDIKNFNKRKEEFEKYKIEEINKIKEGKKNIDLQNKIITKVKIENQSLNITNKNDKETINHLREYINQLKSIIKKKDEEIKLLSKNNNNINNYIINSYKTIGICKDGKISKYNKISNKNKTFRNSILSKNEEDYDTNFINSNSKNNIYYENLNDTINNINNYMNKSSSSIYINDCSKIKKKRCNSRNSEEKDKINSFSGNVFRSQIKLNTSITKRNQKKIINKELKSKEYHHKKLSCGNINITKNTLKNKDNKLKTNIEKNNSLKNSKNQEFSKTSTNFLKQNNNDINNYYKLLKEDSKQKLGEINIDKTDLNNDFQNELDKPLIKGEYDFHIPEKYSKYDYKLIKKEEIDDKEIYFYSNNKKVILFPSGLKKEIFNDGFLLVYFNNGDIKQNFPDGKNIYYFKDANTVQITYPNGIQIFKFYNGQVEKHFPNGFKKIFSPNGKIDYIFSDKKEIN